MTAPGPVTSQEELWDVACRLEVPSPTDAAVTVLLSRGAREVRLSRRGDIGLQLVAALRASAQLAKESKMPQLEVALVDAAASVGEEYLRQLAKDGRP